jgi:hypothetical protein
MSYNDNYAMSSAACASSRLMEVAEKPAFPRSMESTDPTLNVFAETTATLKKRPWQRPPPQTTRQWRSCIQRNAALSSESSPKTS